MTCFANLATIYKKNLNILLWIFASDMHALLSGHPKRRPKIGFQDQLSLYTGQKYCRMLQESILQYIRPSLSYRLPLIPLFCLVLSGPLRRF